MENLQGRNSSGCKSKFLENNTETDKFCGARCGQSLHEVVGIGVVKGFVEEQDDCGCPNSVSSSSWLLSCGQQHINNNNNNHSIEPNLQTKCIVNATTTMTETISISSVTLQRTKDASCTGTERKSEGGSFVNEGDDNTSERKTPGAFETTDDKLTCANAKPKGGLDLEKNGAASIPDDIAMSPEEGVGMVAAALITPLDSHVCAFDAFTAAAVQAGMASRSSSVNNSTENLSFNSDNYFGDELLMLEGDDDIDDVDVDGEEISLNSDDCVYAYRGDGADFDLTLDPVGCRPSTSNTCMMDDETDFLEMDFEPDPLSEVEYGSVETAPSHADAFLMQRDVCHLSGRHSANLGNYSHNGVANQRQLFSSPIDDSVSTPSSKPLQSQLMLSKNFARITMHLDQIKGENGDCDAYKNRPHSDRSSALGMTDDALDTTIRSVINTAHSLPNTLILNFGRDLMHTKEDETNAGTTLKVTGAKPKRFSTFSTSSSTSSKASSKSRNSLRSNYAITPLCNSLSFDERSASCNEFRSVAPKLQASTEGVMHPERSIFTHKSTTTTTTDDCDDLSANDDTCLDCLEKEFLANTIGKAVDVNECTRCRKRSSSSIAIFKRSAQTSARTRCRSGSPLLFKDGHAESIFETTIGAYLQPRNVDWATSTCRDLAMLKDNRCLGDSVSLDKKPRVRTRVRSRTCDADVLQQFKNDEKSIGQRRITGDSCFDNEHLLKNLLLTEKETVTVSTLNLSEELLVQALDKLHVTYNLELIKSHLFYTANTITTNTTTTATNPSMLSAHKNVKDFKDLKDLLMYESRKHCNHPKLKRLIELATLEQVDVKFQEDTTQVVTVLVPVKVADILQIWVRTKNLTVLKTMDKRFIEANILGKIANIIRQAQQRCTQRRPLPEYILVPQYYPAGILKLTKIF